MEIIMKPIGYIKSPYNESNKPPRQGYYSEETGVLELLDEYVQGIEDIKEGSEITIVFNFHKSEGYTIKTNSMSTGEYVGVFSTRSPFRPNSIGISTVRVLEIKGNMLKFKGLDMMDGTPVLDIKPYIQHVSI